MRLVAGQWDSGDVVVAVGRRQRLRGLAPQPGVTGLLLEARSVHGWGLAVAVWFASLDHDGRVRRAGVLDPGGVAADRGAAWFLELPIDRLPPRPGWRLVPIVGGWREP